MFPLQILARKWLSTQETCEQIITGVHLNCYKLLNIEYMIQVRFFPNKNTWRNLWGLLGDVQDAANDFIKKHATRGSNGVHVSPQGVYVTYEDGEFGASYKRYLLSDQAIKNATMHLTQSVVYEALKVKINESEARLAQIDSEVSALEEQKSGDYKEIKPKIDILKAERDYITNQVLPNAKQQVTTTKGDMDRLDAENATIERMLLDLE